MVAFVVWFGSHPRRANGAAVGTGNPLGTMKQRIVDAPDPGVRR